MKNRLLMAVALMPAALFFAAQAHAVDISLTIPGSAASDCASPTSMNCKPGNIINNFYQFALLIGGIIAFGTVVYGGVKYTISGGNPSAQTEAKQWIEGALLGLLLLGGAYLILYTINPNLTNLNLPTLQSVNFPAAPQGLGGPVGTGPAGTTPGGEPGSLAASQLAGAGVGIKPGASVDGMQQSTVNDIQGLAAQCAASNGGSSCNVIITAGVDGDHAGGTCSHANGYKADLRSSSASLNAFITSLPSLPKKRSDGATLYVYGGGTIADERNLPGIDPHWDLSGPCSG